MLKDGTNVAPVFGFFEDDGTLVAFRREDKHLKAQELAEAGGITAMQPTHPYALTWDLPPPTSSFSVTFPAMRVQFPAGAVTVPAYTLTAAPQQIIDLWLTDRATFQEERVGLNDWPNLPRHEGMLHVARVQSSASKIAGVYMRRPMLPVIKRPAPRPLSSYHFARQFFVPTSWSTWANNSAATRGTVYRTSSGDLWHCETAGTTELQPAAPTYSDEANSGFDLVTSGTATFTFRGRSTYAGAWRVSPRAGVTWYFGLIAAGLLAHRFPAEAKACLQNYALHLVNDWVSGVFYTVGRKVGGAATKGRVWECVTQGTTTATAPFPADAAVGTTCTENGVVWRCEGTFAHPGQRFFVYDTDPTMRVLKSPDSHDSYAAVWVWAVWRYLKATNDSAWLNQAGPHAMTYQQLIREVIYYNLSTQIASENLTRVFQGEGVPFGGTYAARFLMDNAEVYAGFKAAERIYTTWVPDSGYAGQMGAFAAQIAGGMEALWDEGAGAYRYVHGLPSMVPFAPGSAPFYPLLMSQSWPTLWGVPLNRERTDRAYSYMHQHYPHWWARNDVDDLLAIGAHYGLIVNGGLRTQRDDIVRHVEGERMAAGQPDLYVHDAAYYLCLRDESSIRDLLT